MQIECSHMRVLSLVSRRRASSSDKLQKDISGQRDTGRIKGGTKYSTDSLDINIHYWGKIRNEALS